MYKSFECLQKYKTNLVKEVDGSEISSLGKFQLKNCIESVSKSSNEFSLILNVYNCYYQADIIEISNDFQKQKQKMDTSLRNFKNENENENQQENEKDKFGKWLLVKASFLCFISAQLWGVFIYGFILPYIMSNNFKLSFFKIWENCIDDFQNLKLKLQLKLKEETENVIPVEKIISTPISTINQTQLKPIIEKKFPRQEEEHPLNSGLKAKIGNRVFNLGDDKGRKEWQDYCKNQIKSSATKDKKEISSSTNREVFLKSSSSNISIDNLISKPNKDSFNKENFNESKNEKQITNTTVTFLQKPPAIIGFSNLNITSSDSIFNRENENRTGNGNKNETAITNAAITNLSKTVPTSTTTTTTTTTNGDNGDNSSKITVSASANIQRFDKNGKAYRRIFIPGQGWISAKRLEVV
ncbi:hypothetical protein PACTADRAFT_34059 [Pachysolen tannophilus NRRL Y-2460]|uniref:Uncharacterized protein n=1 Tax=Pachysolen tannophilus NRRL Y-2460 TaxID=669874 RepID=A0A1E4TUN3_PACTA|nr:hypothetical protein PACTADRAFT_34059 [Pachysolen tannophilus NRRL Y-2460]